MTVCVCGAMMGTLVEPGQVLAATTGGAVAGALAGATGGASLFGSELLGEATAGAVSNVAGGIAERTVNGDGAEEVFSTGKMSEQAALGFLGGGAGHLAADVIHIPEDPALPGPRRHAVGRRKLAKYDATIAANNNLRMYKTGISTAVGVGVAHSVETVVNNFWNILDWLVSSPAPPPNDYATDITIQYHLP